MTERVYRVAMGKGMVGSASDWDVITSSGIGSCIALVIYDPINMTGGLAHIMLPAFTGSSYKLHPYAYADSAVKVFITRLTGIGSDKKSLVAKAAGGANMFTNNHPGTQTVGEQNVLSVKLILEKYKIPLIGADLGGKKGRSVELKLIDGGLFVSTIEGEIKEI